MKKIFIIFLLSISLFTGLDYSYSDFNWTTWWSSWWWSSSGWSTNCTYDIDSENPAKVWEALDWCLQWSQLVDWTDTFVEGWWFAQKIINWVNNISIYLWVLAVWSIVYWAFIMTISAWQDEKITKAKNNIKWWIIWFIALISAAWIINLIVSIMYSL